MSTSCLILLIAIVSTSTGQKVATFNNVRQQLQQMDLKTVDRHKVVTQLAQLQQHILPSLLSTKAGICDIIPNPYGYLNISDLCYISVCDTVQALQNQQNTWPIKVLDSWGKLPPNALAPTLMWSGDYRECVGINVPAENNFNMQYCYVIATIEVQKQYLPFYYGICMPNACSEQEVPILFDIGIGELVKALNMSTFPLFATGAACQLESQELSSNAVLVLIILSLFVFLMAIATAYDVYLRHVKSHDQHLPVHNNPADIVDIVTAPKTPLANNEHRPLLHNVDMPTKEQSLEFPSRLLLSFSIYTNGSKLLSTNQGAGALTCINGIRFLSISWVLLGHSYVFGLTIIENALQFEMLSLKQWTYQAIYNATVSVDSFFVLSGLLLTYLFLKEAKKNDGKVNWGMFYFHRFWRLTPPYMLFMMTYSTLFKYLSSGPFWPKDGVEPNCGDYWWRNILYINNFFDQKEMCMGWSWYLANDMQFYVISPLLLIPLFWFPIAGLICCAVLCWSSIIATGIISSHYHIPAGTAQINNAKPSADGFDLIYDKPWTRIGPYIVGMLTGYVLYRYKCSPPFKTEYKNWAFSLCGWCVAAVCCTSVLYGLFNASQNGGMTYQVAALYNAMNRTVWAVGLCWVIYACCIGYGGFVNTLLSWKAFIPLSRLTYCVYLIHPVLMYYYYYSRETLIHMTSFTAVYFFLGHVVLSFGCAFVTSLAFESPMLGIEKAIFGKRKKA